MREAGLGSFYSGCGEARGRGCGGVPRDAAARELEGLGPDFEGRLVRRGGSVETGLKKLPF